MAELTPDRRLLRNRANRYLQDRPAMLTDNYMGVVSICLAAGVTIRRVDRSTR